MHPFADSIISSFSRSIQHIPYAPHSEITMLAALLTALYERQINTQGFIQEILDTIQIPQESSQITESNDTKMPDLQKIKNKK